MIPAPSFAYFPGKRHEIIFNSVITVDLGWIWAFLDVTILGRILWLEIPVEGEGWGGVGRGGEGEMTAGIETKWAEYAN